MEVELLYLLVKIISLIIPVFLYNKVEVGITTLVISTLSFACLFTLELLLKKLLSSRRFVLLTNFISFILCIPFGTYLYLPLMIVILIHIVELTVAGRLFYSILAVSVVLSVMIFTPDIVIILYIFILLMILLSGRILVHRYLKLKETNQNQRESIIELNQRIIDIKNLNKTVKYTVSMEERNRIAARIHDQLGHGISGSIILLEAALLVLKEDTDKAAATIGKAVNNLREGVDDIRASLRDERAKQYLIGKNDIKSLLEEFKITYNKDTIFYTSGDLELISMEIWACIHDNLKECLTNLLKHSNATRFRLSIEVFQKIIKVEYSDNGSNSESLKKGIGLEVIEERTIQSGGRCFFHHENNGFSITNIFTT